MNIKKTIYLFLLIFFALILVHSVFAHFDSSTSMHKDDTSAAFLMEDEASQDKDDTEDDTENGQPVQKQESDTHQESIHTFTDIREVLPQSYFISPLSNQSLKGEVRIEFYVEDALSVEFYTRRTGALVAVYLGMGTKKEGQTWQYLWQTKNYPNGEHKLYAKITNQYGSYESEAIKIIIDNPIPLEEESQDKAHKIITDKEQINQKIKEEKLEEKEKLKEVIEEEIIEELVPKRVDEDEVEEVIQQDVLPEVEELDDKIEEIAAAERELEKVQHRRDESQKKIIEEKLAQLTHQKEEIKKEIVKKSERVLHKVAPTDVERVEKEERIKEKIARHIDTLEHSLALKEEERYEHLKEIEKRDSDGDEIPDLEEARLGTDILNPDTDGDGYLDSDEIEHGYDPLTPSPGDKIVFEDPREKGEIKPEYEVVSIATSELPDGQVGVLLTGRGLPHSFVTIYIYSSQPIVVIAKTDEHGNWSYLLDKPLEDGEHEVYVAVTNNKGEISYKSEPKYFIKQAQAITSVAASSIFDEEKPGAGLSREQSSRIAYLVLGLSIIVFAAGVALIIIGLRISRRKNNEDF